MIFAVQYIRRFLYAINRKKCRFIYFSQKSLRKFKECMEYHTMRNCAIFPCVNDIGVLQYLYVRGVRCFDTDLRETAAIRGWLQVLKWAHARGILKMTDSALELAIRANRVEIIDWIIQCNFTQCFTPFVLCYAAAHGNLEIYTKLERMYKDINYEFVCGWASRYGLCWSRRVLNFIHAQGVITPQIYDSILIKGCKNKNLQLLNWVYTHGHRQSTHEPFIYITTNEIFEWMYSRYWRPEFFGNYVYMHDTFVLRQIIKKGAYVFNRQLFNRLWMGKYLYDALALLDTATADDAEGLYSLLVDFNRLHTHDSLYGGKCTCRTNLYLTKLMQICKRENVLTNTRLFIDFKNQLKWT